VWFILDAVVDTAVSQSQLDRLEALLNERAIRVERVRAVDADPIAAQWRLLYLGDWVSYYLAILYGVDPMPVPTIQQFKSQIQISNFQ
jgi:glucose/mannose-6-phosphate isomerase